MSDSPTTRLTLLARLRNVQDERAWAEFVELYAPLVYRLARKHGLQDADAADLTQDVLRSVVHAAPQFTYDPQRGSFRGWLFTVAHNQLRKFANTRKRQTQGSGDRGAQEVLEGQPAPHDDAAEWDQEYQQRVLEWAAQKVRGQFRPNTWDAFWRTTMEGADPKQVSSDLGMSMGAVYIAKSRVLARIKDLIQQLPDA